MLSRSLILRRSLTTATLATTGTPPPPPPPSATAAEVAAQYRLMKAQQAAEGSSSPSGGLSPAQPLGGGGVRPNQRMSGGGGGGSGGSGGGGSSGGNQPSQRPSTTFNRSSSLSSTSVTSGRGGPSSMAPPQGGHGSSTTATTSSRTPGAYGSTPGGSRSGGAGSGSGSGGSGSGSGSVTMSNSSSGGSGGSSGHHVITGVRQQDPPSGARAAVAPLDPTVELHQRLQRMCRRTHARFSEPFSLFLSNIDSLSKDKALLSVTLLHLFHGSTATGSDDDVMRVFKFITDTPGVVTFEPVLYNGLCQLAQRGKTHLVRSLLDLMPQVPDTYVFTQLVSEYGWSGQTAAMMDLLNYAAQRGVPSNELTAAVVVCVLLRDNQVAMATDYFGSLKLPSLPEEDQASIVASIVSTFVDKRVPHNLTTLVELVLSACPRALSLSSVNMLLFSLVKAKRSSRSPLQQSVTSSVTPPSSSSSFSASSVPAPSASSSSLPPPSTVLSSSSVPTADWWESVLSRAGLSPNRLTFNLLIEERVKGKDVRGAERVVERMRAANVPLTDMTYVHLIMGHKEEGNSASIEALIAEMKSGDFLLTPYIYSLLAASYAKEGKGAEARSLLQTVEEMGLKPSVEMYNAILSAYLDDKDTMKAILDHQAKKEVLPNIETFSLRARAAARKKDDGGVVAVMNEMTRLDLEPTMTQYTAWISCFADDTTSTRVNNVLRTLSRSFLKPSVAVTGIALKVFAAAHDEGSARALLESLIDVDLSAVDSSSQALIETAFPSLLSTPSPLASALSTRFQRLKAATSGTPRASEPAEPSKGGQVGTPSDGLTESVAEQNFEPSQSEDDVVEEPGGRPVEETDKSLSSRKSASTPGPTTSGSPTSDKRNAEVLARVQSVALVRDPALIGQLKGGALTEQLQVWKYREGRSDVTVSGTVAEKRERLLALVATRQV